MPTLAHALQTLRSLFPRLIAYASLFAVLSVTVLTPFTAWVLHSFVSRTGSPAVTNVELASFALSPLGLTTLFVTGAVWLGTSFLNSAGIMRITGHHLRGETMTASAAILTTVKAAPRLIQLGLYQLGWAGLCFLPFGLTCIEIYSFSFVNHDINFFLATRPPVLYIAGGLLVFFLACYAVVLLLLYLRWIFAVPLVVADGLSPADAMQTSARLMKGRFGATARRLAVWWITILLIGVLANTALDWVDGPILALAGDQLVSVIPLVALVVFLHVSLAVIIAFVSFTTHYILIGIAFEERQVDRIVVEVDMPGTGPIPAAPGKAQLYWGVAAVLLFGTIYTGYQIVDSIETTNRPLITAHRGSSHAAPENTLAAVRQAIADQANFAEIDVQEIADGTIVVLHDTDLMRICQVDKKIWDVRFDEIKDLDAGSWFAPEFATERIPTLDQMLALAKGKIDLNIELKYHGHEKNLEALVLELIGKHAFADNCVITSLNANGLALVRNRAPDIRIGLIAGAAIGDLSAHDVDFLSVRTGLVNQSLTALLALRDKGLHVWTVNDHREMLRMVDMRVENVITDVPAEFRALLLELDALTPAQRVLLSMRNFL